jgi:hypothetical protein
MTTGVSELVGCRESHAARRWTQAQRCPALRVHSLEGLLFDVRKVNPHKTFFGGDRSTV